MFIISVSNSFLLRKISKKRKRKQISSAANGMRTEREKAKKRD